MSGSLESGLWDGDIVQDATLGRALGATLTHGGERKEAELGRKTSAVTWLPCGAGMAL